MFLKICGALEQATEGASLARWPWPMRTVYYHEDLEIQGLDKTTTRNLFDAAAKSISDVCGLTLKRTTDPRDAHIVAHAEFIDGPWGIMGESEIPYGATPESCMRQTYDPDGPWDAGNWQACVAHELCHALGLPHLPGTGALMEPMLIVGRVLPQPPDVAELVARYGPRTSPAPIDWVAIGRQLVPYLVGPVADGLLWAAPIAAKDGQGAKALQTVGTHADSVRAYVWDQLVAPKLQGLTPEAQAEALRGLAAGVGSGMGAGLGLGPQHATATATATPTTGGPDR